MKDSVEIKLHMANGTTSMTIYDKDDIVINGREELYEIHRKLSNHEYLLSINKWEIVAANNLGEVLYYVRLHKVLNKDIKFSLIDKDL